MKLFFSHTIQSALGILVGALTLYSFSTPPKHDLVTIITFFLIFSSLILPAKIKTFILCLSLGFWHTYADLSAYFKDNLTKQELKKTVEIKGTVKKVLSKNNKVTFLFKATQIITSDRQINHPSYLLKIVCNNQNALKIYPASNIKLIVKLREIKNFNNPGSYDQEKDFFVKNIRYLGHVLNSNIIYTIASDSLDPLGTIEKYRFKLLDHYWSDNYFAKKEFIGLALSLTLADQSLLKKDHKILLRDTGTSHLMAISGMHIGLICYSIFKLVDFFCRRSYKLLSTYPSKKIAILSTWLLVLLYCIITGFSVSTQRAFIMLSILQCSAILKKHIHTVDIIFATLFTITLIHPRELCSIGFWLSFISVIVLYTTVSIIQGTWLKKAIISQLCFFLCLLPVNLYLFNHIGSLVVITNLVAIPFVTYLSLPLGFLTHFLIKFSTLHKLVGTINEQLSSSLFIFLKIISLKQHVLHFTPTLFLTSLSFLGGLIQIFRSNKYLIYAGSACWLLVFLPTDNKLQEGEYKLNILDVGQGLSVLIQTKNHNILYDAGPKYSKNTNAANQVILPLLDKWHISSLDKIIISHLDLDHRGGLNSLIEKIPYKKIYTSEVSKLSTPAEFCQGSWNFDGVNFSFLHPVTQQRKAFKTRNNLSCVMKITNGKVSTVLPGDIEKKVEQKLVKQYKDKLKASILLVPHHGSNSSSSKEFIAYVKPDLAIISAGYNNIYSHPRKEVIDRYKKIGAKLFTTNHDGIIIITVGNYYNVRSHRLTAQKIWQK